MSDTEPAENSDMETADDAADSTAEPSENPGRVEDVDVDDVTRMVPVGPRTGPHREKTVRGFDFRRPNKLSREYVRALQIVQETFARGVTTQVSSTLRALTHVMPGEIEQRTYDEFLRSISNPSHIAILEISPLPGASVLCIPLAVAFAIVELQLGGTLGEKHPDRGLTDIEAGLVRHFTTERVLPEMRYAMESLVEVTPKIVAVESNPQFAQIATATDMVVVIGLVMRIEDIEEEIFLCIPFSAIQPILDEVTGGRAQMAATADAEEAVRKLRVGLQDVPLVASARLASVPMLSQDVVALQPGDIVHFPHHQNKPVTLFVDSVPVWKASLGVAPGGRRVAVQVVDEAH